MSKFLVDVDPTEPANGKGTVIFYEYADDNPIGRGAKVLEKEFRIGMQSDRESLIVEGKMWLKDNKQEIRNELGNKGYEEPEFQFHPTIKGV